jgi:hypothetical protein
LTVYENLSFITLCQHVFGSSVPHMQIVDCDIEAFVVVSISACSVLGCDMVWCNFPGHYNVLQNCFCVCISDSTDVLIRLYVFLISNFRHFVNVLCFLLGNSPVSEFYMPTFRNTLPVPSSRTMDTALNRYDEPWNRQHGPPRPIKNPP